MTAWIDWDVALLLIYRRLGYADASERLQEACALGEVAGKYERRGQHIPSSVFDVDLEEWIKGELNRAPQGKQPRILRLLAEMFPNGVPNPADYPRKKLRADLLKADPGLDPLDEATLKKAIDWHNRNVPNRIVSD